MRWQEIFRATVAILVCEAAGAIGAIFTTPAIPTWYARLAKPALNPPSWVFGPVWTTLYALMGIAVFIVWRKGVHRREAKIALSIFALQLALNTLWPIIFFGMRNLGGGFIEIIAMLLTIVATIAAFGKISKTAALLLLPYIAWVCFASYLNFMLWTLNS